MPNRTTRLLALLLPLVLLTLLPACRNTWSVENRETPVHVWLTVPDLEEKGGTLDALIYVGSEKAIEGPVRFPPGVKTVALPTLFMRTSSKTVVSAVFEGGAISSTKDVSIGTETWVQIVLKDRKVQIAHYGAQP